MEFIRIVYTDEDVRSIAEEFEIDEDVAFKRAEAWGRHIEDTASSLAGEQFVSCIRFNAP